jgi:hypothetical protein
MNLYKYHSLEDSQNKQNVIVKLESLKKEGKINYEQEDKEVFSITDIDLDNLETNDLITFFDENDVIPYLEREYDDEQYNFYDEDSEDGFKNSDDYYKDDWDNESYTDESF